ncbi:hypothetical protein [Streptomyces palmae]|uniref:Translation initiation factor 2 n=1 Tax=Streptomyces palmae TaxID=1701085 RepID=A0A4Z0HI20_9ACTN|nr:hypothetical protein [Streptomyces palmae]TGB18433.1 hypothetical protein E4099_02025 [Streptomyces palmae]
MPAAPVFGLSREWLLHRGRPIAAATVLSHPEQLARLTDACPEAAATAVLGGDPCYDRMLAALPDRERFRRALGVGPDQRLILVNSTWGPRSLLGDGAADPLPALLPRLAAELPLDEYRTAAVLHPNIWYGHGPGQVRAWLDRAGRAGLTLVPPLAGWRQALIAADCVIGDHGSVTFYAAALGTPVLLGAFPEGDLDPDSPVAALGRTAPRLDPRRGLRHQLDQVMAGHDPRRYADITAATSSDPGRSATLLRRLCYRLIGIPEPVDPALLDRLPLPEFEPARPSVPIRVLTRLIGAGRGEPPGIAVTRYADADQDPEPDEELSAAHTVVPEDTRDPGRLSLADVIVGRGAADDPRWGPPGAWAAEVLDRHRHCALAVHTAGPDSCTVRTRAGLTVRLTAAPDADGRPALCDPAAYASALYAWLSQGKDPAELMATGMTVHTGRARYRVAVRSAG